MFVIGCGVSIIAVPHFCSSPPPIPGPARRYPAGLHYPGARRVFGGGMSGGGARERERGGGGGKSRAVLMPHK